MEAQVRLDSFNILFLVELKTKEVMNSLHQEENVNLVSVLASASSGMWI
jgi:hypothetical protein